MGKWCAVTLGGDNPTSLIRTMTSSNGKNFSLQGRSEHGTMTVSTQMLRKWIYTYNASKNDTGGLL